MLRIRLGSAEAAARAARIPGAVEVRHEPPGIRVLRRRLELRPGAQLLLEVLAAKRQHLDGAHRDHGGLARPWFPQGLFAEDVAFGAAPHLDLLAILQTDVLNTLALLQEVEVGALLALCKDEAPVVEVSPFQGPRKGRHLHFSQDVELLHAPDQALLVVPFGNHGDKLFTTQLQQLHVRARRDRGGSALLPQESPLPEEAPGGVLQDLFPLAVDRNGGIALPGIHDETIQAFVALSDDLVAGWTSSQLQDLCALLDFQLAEILEELHLSQPVLPVLQRLSAVEGPVDEGLVGDLVAIGGR
mmetsp:Transcript_37832/g.90493  ORF Transcript_37832/g.90493 Transcript_37832/m.90493 type:complete len:301 (+) Transcript_37832:112-1014(+)